MLVVIFLGFHQRQQQISWQVGLDRIVGPVPKKMNIVMKGDLGSGYYKTPDEEIFFVRSWSNLLGPVEEVQLTGVDVESFETLDSGPIQVRSEIFRRDHGGYAKDTNYFYKDGEIVQGVNPANIRTFDAYGDALTTTSPWSDATYIVIPGYSVLVHMPREPGSSYERQREVKVIENADPNTFSVMRWPYSKDAKSVFYKATPIEGADTNTFTVMNGVGNEMELYASDGKNVYRNDRRIEGIVSTDTFTLLSRSYIKNTKGVFYLRDDFSEEISVIPVIGVDTETFSVIEQGYTKDKYGDYIYGMKAERLGVDPDSIKFFDMGYGVDFPAIVAPQDVPESYLNISEWGIFRDEEFGVEFKFPGAPENVRKVVVGKESVCFYSKKYADLLKEYPNKEGGVWAILCVYNTDPITPSPRSLNAYTFFHRGKFFVVDIRSELSAAVAGSIKTF